MPSRRSEPSIGAADVVARAAGDRIVVAPLAPAELRRDHDPVAPPGERAAEDSLALAVAVALGGVEERDPGVERGVDDGPRARPRRSAQPKLLQPSPTTETTSPDGPRVRVRISPTVPAAESGRPWSARFRATTWKTCQCLRVPITVVPSPSNSSRRSISNGAQQLVDLGARLHDDPRAAPTRRCSPKSWPQKRPPGRSESTIRRQSSSNGSGGQNGSAKLALTRSHVGPRLVLEAARRASRAAPTRAPASARSRSIASCSPSIAITLQPRRRSSAVSRPVPAPRSTARPGLGEPVERVEQRRARVVAGHVEVAAPAAPRLVEHAQPVAVRDLRERLVVVAARARAPRRGAAARRRRRARPARSAPSKSEPNATWSTPIRSAM